jgi:hypothetical protein
VALTSQSFESIPVSVWKRRPGEMEWSNLEMGSQFERWKRHLSEMENKIVRWKRHLSEMENKIVRWKRRLSKTDGLPGEMETIIVRWRTF